ncbi:MAG: helix-turn-helix domain-containing protein [Clostridia bacterium]|nr:helix-turn-helix domain-containing protein [Clostridia bacterium]
MLNDNELGLLCDTFKKSHVATAIVEKEGLKAKINGMINSVFPSSATENRENNTQDIIELLPKTVYKMTNSFGLSYVYFKISERNDDKILLIGPYLNERPNGEKILEYAEKNALQPKYHRYLEEYYSSLPAIPKESFLFVMLTSFCERLWNLPAFAIVDVNNEYDTPISPIGSTPKEENFDEILADMKAMEKRYEYENELIEAVSLGQVHKENLFTSSFSDMLFEKRAPDLLRNAKNYCVIMNTLLRKAAESGGVHPLYIDRVSSDFAYKIENMSQLGQTAPLMRKMYTSYCSLVQKHTMRGFSELIKNTVLLIDSDISAQLSPGDIAKAQNVSLGYLSTLFRKETGKTLTEYIKAKRIAHAKHLLCNTQLQIQTVALHCGVVDLQYFSKLFKKETGKTPKQYREEYSGR